MENKKRKILDLKTLRQIIPFVKPYALHFYLLVFLTLIIGLLSPLRPLLINFEIDNHIAVNDKEGLLNITLVLILIAIVEALLQYIHTYLSGWFGQNIIKDIRIAVYKQMIFLKRSFYDQNKVGRLVTRVVSDIETLLEVFTNGIAAITADLLKLLFIVLAMFYINWKMALVSLITFPLMVLGTYIFKEKIKYAFFLVRNAVSDLNAFVQERLVGMQIVQIFNVEDQEYKKFQAINRNHLKANLKTVLYYSLYFPIAEILAAMAIGFIVWYGAGKVVQAEISLGTLTAFIMYTQLFFRPLRMIADRFNTLQLGIVSAERILKLLNNRDFIPIVKNPLPLSNLQGHIRFENVSFAYDKNNYVLKNISFQVRPSQTVAIVGETGSGKSSIINLILRFYEINKGTIYIDNQAITKYNLSDLRRRIGLILQDVFLFSDSIKNNITLFDASITLEQVKAAARLIEADKFIEQLPGAYDYQIGERGLTLSVGQRQLLSFIRVMVHNPQLLILDEATSSVDNETELLIQRAITHMMEDRTAIVIAHRLATIERADQIIVLDKGEIKEIGTHESLLAAQGFYKTLYDVQYNKSEESSPVLFH